MSSGADFFLKKALGDDFFQSLEKIELWKMGTKTVIDHEEMKTALQIVPRTLMSFLIKNLQTMQIGETKEIPLEIRQSNPPDGLLRVSKHERDVYSGEIEGATEKYTDKKIAEFKYRSIPGIGLVIMSAFEMYNVDDLTAPAKHEISSDTIAAVQKMIDDRLSLHDLINKVVDKKITERDAIQALVLAKLSDSIEKPKEAKSDVNINVDISPEIKVENKIRIKKGSPLKGFLETRTQKLKKSEFKIELMKGEQLNCPDCGQSMFDGNIFSACICYGDCGKVFLKKAETGFVVRFSKNWDTENIMMFLEVLRRRRG